MTMFFSIGVAIHDYCRNLDIIKLLLLWVAMATVYQLSSHTMWTLLGVSMESQQYLFDSFTNRSQMLSCFRIYEVKLSQFCYMGAVYTESKF